MFDASTYVQRRAQLRQRVGSGLILFLGNPELPMYYAANTFHFRQDSSFLYFWGLDDPDLAAVIDADDHTETVFGDDFTVDDIVWRGPQPTVAERAAKAGVTCTAPRATLVGKLSQAIRQGRRIHFLPQYVAENRITLERLLGIRAEVINDHASGALIQAVVAQRAIKSAEEVREIEAALDTCYEMHTLAMKLARPGVYEREVAGAIEGVVASRGVRLAFPVIFSIHGETLHNHCHDNLMQAGQMAVNDSGAESARHYAGDITRTIPIGGTFVGPQRDLYLSVLNAQRKAIAAVRPGVKFKDVHLLAGRCLLSDLKDLGCVTGNLDDAVAAGVQGLFFQCGLGHMMGLDVHDMEGLGEQHVGYDETVERSTQFGLKSLRMARALQPGFVMTVEPGLYFIPQLIDRWRAEGRFTEFVNWDVVERFRAFGGIRVEDDVLVTETGCRVLGRPIPIDIDDVERLAAG
ncbi:MAG: aminopeptidase P family protein [Acidobacteria bacterium]|nr:aminopeptidase P family protein [Acidobacteriota bacterium]